MAEPPPASSRTPPGTPLSEPTRPHKDLMEDRDSEGTRKRPRLDSGSRVSETVSIDSPSLTTPAAPASDMDVTSDSGHPASKMTINVRSPTSEMPRETVDPSPVPPVTTSQPQSPEPDATSANVISISSSPAQSPEIEVAELEDMDQDPNTSSWRPLEEAIWDQAPPEVVEVEDMVSLVDSFPKVRDRMGARDNLNVICMMIDKGDSRDTTAFTAVKGWMDDCVRNLDRLTPEAFAEDSDFWECLPSVTESLLRRGQELPVDDGSGTRICLEEFLLDYVQITLHLIRLDIMILRLVLNDPDTPVPESLSQRYLQPLGWALLFQSIPFYRALDKLYDTEASSLVLQVRAKTIAPPIDAPTALAEYASLLLAIIPRSPQLSNILVYIVNVANSIVDCALERKYNVDDDATVDLSTHSPSTKLLYDTVRCIDDKYQGWIIKKSPWVSSELSDQMVRQIPRCYNLFCLRDPEFVHQLSRDLSIELADEVDSEDNALILFWGWKFGVLKKHIMEGRMELRVHGVETMQSDLVSIWKQNIAADPAGLALPFVQYLVRFIQENKIVDYLVGVDSHPQLISRSSNIVGFLIVTSTYTNLETDIIWKTVTESQDSRIISEVLSMLIRTFYMHQTASPALLYLCEKVLELPLDRFDTRMFDFCDNLLNRMSEKPSDQGFYDQSGVALVHAIPLRLCVRLIRESTAADNLTVEQRKQLQNFGSRQLAGFIKAGISEADRMEMYERCIQDIADMNQFTAGSIQALSALVPAHDVQEMWKLATDFDLTRLVIKDLLHTVNGDHFDFSDAFSQHGLVSRVTILFRLVDMAPETITPELGQALWNEILLSDKLGPDGHKIVWNMMVGALSRSSKPNPFLERCIHEYLPSLVPEDYSHELLGFAKQSINYEVRFNPPPTAGANEVVTIPGMDRIWTFILTSPPGSIEAEATKFAIEVYLDHQIISSSPRSAVDATHIAIVNRCIDQLKSAAEALRLPESAAANGEILMEIENSNDEMGPEELSFRRSLLFLHRLLHGLRARPQYSSPKGSPPQLPERPVKGNALDLSWQCFNGNTSSNIKTLKIGDASTAAELVEELTQLTGFSKFTAICGGQRLDLLEDPEALLGDIKVLHSGLLILRKAPDAREVSRENGRQSLTSVDSEVLKHFDEIYGFLALREDIAREVFNFLIVFPPPDRILDLVRSEQNNEKDLFPYRKPFIAFYSFHVLLICLREEALEASPNQSFVSHSIKSLEAFLMADELSKSLNEDRIRFFLAVTAVECLLSALAVYRPTSDEASLCHDPTPLVKRLLGLIEMARSAPATSLSALNQKLICCSFAVIVEGSMQDDKFWDAVKQQAQFGQLVHALLLEESRQPVRNEVAERIKMTCSPSKLLKQPAKTADGEVQTQPPTESPARIDMLGTIWNSFVQTIPKTPEYASQSAEFFKVALWVFRSVAERSPRDVIFSQYLRQWSEVMFSHRTEEFVGRESVDDLILGFACLLELCIDLADTANVELDTFDLAAQILDNYLFPDLTPETDDQLVPRVPVMHTATRQKLFNIINLLCKQSDVNLAQVMDQLENAVPRDYTCGTNWFYDRPKMIRAPEGYAGLQNLSNTCYLNSLMTQLFMNVEFRDFMLKLDLKDPHSSQKLLAETQRLFAWMQDTWTKSVDPEGFVESIQTYDNEAIDVSIQMDVDEFYNLLFDRWEAQVDGSEEKTKFRSFYGGQLVQQIKSKECSHISERLEPFSAIQCDIKGKASLEESLQAYVEGEIMQGDNKYSCTACGRHVDAVKRACLKDVPDNLIFHLKRFDFDMFTMLRSKINDEFQFPERIDMTPYKVEYLSEPDAHAEPDVFELVGVLVHTGTAESGHYYSYTRERPTAGAASSWVEFNDSDVSSFDPSTIADQCFGGPSESVHTMGGVQLNKAWNAYMLFYQRVSTAQKSKEVYKPPKRDCPVRVPVPISLSNHIAMENELFIRCYCLLDPVYAWFVQNLLQHLQYTAPDFTPKPRLESLAMDVGLDTFEQLVARTKDHVCFDGISSELYKLLGRNPQAAVRALQWFCGRETSMRNLILRTANSEVRQKGIMLILGAVKRLQNFLMDLSLDGHDRDVARSRFEPLVEHIVVMLEALWPALQTAPRVWDDYFDFLLGLAESGPEITAVLLDNDFLVRCMEIIWLDQEDRMRLRGPYMNYSRMLEKGRQFSYKSLMSLCAALFRSIDFSLPPVLNNAARTMTPDEMYPLSMTESKFIKALENDGLSFLLKILQQDNLGNPQASRRIVAAMLASEPQAGFLEHIIRTLEAGLRFSPADLCIPFLNVTLVFCKHCPGKIEIADIINYVAKGVDSINDKAGVDHLEFFTRLCSVFNERAMLKSEWFLAMVQDKIPDFAPTLLIDSDRTVRQGTIELLQSLLFSSESEEVPEESRSRYVQIARNLTQCCVDRINSSFLNGQVRNVDSRRIQGIVSIITHCLDTYFDESEEDRQIVEQTNASLLNLEQITTEVQDDLVSESDLPSPEEWEATSALASDSEMGLVGSP